MRSSDASALSGSSGGLAIPGGERRHREGNLCNNNVHASAMPMLMWLTGTMVRQAENPRTRKARATAARARVVVKAPPPHYLQPAAAVAAAQQQPPSVSPTASTASPARQQSTLPPPRSLRFAEHLELCQCTRRRAAKGAGRISTPGLKPDGRFTLSQNFF